MSIEILSLAGFIIAIVLGSIRNDINTGIIAIALAFGIGFYAAGFSISEVSSFFPAELFLILVGITLMFYMAKDNGTLDKITRFAIWLTQGKSYLIPVLLFGLALILSAIGAGNIAAVAIIAPIGMPVAYKFKINPLLSSIMICTGANAGTFSPVAPTGIINQSLMQGIGIEDENLGFEIFLLTLILQSVAAVAAYFLFKGYKKQNHIDPDKNLNPSSFSKPTKKQLITICFISSLILLVIIFDVPIGLGAFAVVIVMAALNLSPLEQAIKEIPWSPILLVSGITILIVLITRTGGLMLATDFIADKTSVNYINTVLASLAGLVSLYSSSSGVAMPTFINLIPGLLEKFGASNAKEMIVAINVGSHLVDVSPLSTLGALCIASLEEKDRSKVFRELFLWGFSMLIFGGLLAYLFLDLF
jgi:di/tricarboxylate transporter